MENTSKHDDRDPDDNNLLEPEIDDEILNAFMEVDPIFDPTTPDLDVEPWDPNFTVDSFTDVTNPNARYNIHKVFVDFVWFDTNANTFYYFLHDKNGVNIAAQVPPDLVPAYKHKDFEKTFVSIHKFKVVYADPTKYPRYQTYSFLRRDWYIMVDSDTVITDNPFSEETGFEMYPWLPSLNLLVNDKTERKMLINTVGRVIRGALQYPKGRKTCEIWLRDITGSEIKFVAFHTLRKLAVKFARIIQEQGIIYLTRVKLVHDGSVNLLLDTELTDVEFDPKMRKAKALLNMTI